MPERAFLFNHAIIFYHKKTSQNIKFKKYRIDYYLGYYRLTQLVMLVFR